MGWFEKKDRNNDVSSFLKRSKEHLDPYLSSATTNGLVSFVEAWSTPQLMVLGTASTVSFLLGMRAARFASSWRRITTLQDLNSSQIGPNSKFLTGRVVSVSDGDTFRFYHVPTMFHSPQLPEGAKKSEICLPIRVCTIDTPETPKFGKAGQPYGDEAKKRLSDLVLNQNIRIQLLLQDQYGRGVAQVQRGRWPFRKFVDEVMLRAGLAEVYLGGGAVYGSKGKDYYLDLQENAKNGKVGMWKLGEKLESAAAYKARTK